MTSAPEDSAVQSTLGSYRLLGELGRDPLGVLHLACPAGATTFPRWAVVRRLHAGLARDPAMVHAFLAATQAAARVVHANVARTFDFGGKMNLPWAAREHLFGVSVLDLVDRVALDGTPIPWPLAAHVVAAAAAGVGAVRMRLPTYGPPMGFLTGAVAPSVFLTDEGEVKLVDACLPLVEGVPLVDSRAVPYLLRPEEGDAARADTFGLAVILWELVAGRRLFAAGDDDESARRVEARVVPALGSPPFLDELLQRTLGRSASPVGALANAAELSAELRSALSAAGVDVGAADVRTLVARAFPTALAEQRGRVAEAWLRELALQQQGGAAADVTSDAELTRPNDDTARDETGETAVSRRDPFGGGFDEVPTAPRNRVEAPSWRPESATNVPAPRSIPRLEDLPVTPAPPAAWAPLAPRIVEAADDSTSRSARTERPAALALPPVERSMTSLADASLARPRREKRPLRSQILLASLGFALVIATAVGVWTYRAATNDPDAASTATIFTSPPTRPSVGSPAPRSTGPWTPLPVGSIPVSSPDELPRAPAGSTSRGVLSRGAARPSLPSGRTGLLSVYCAPACDEVLDGTRALGPSPVFKAPVTVGQHRIRLRVAAAEKTVSVTVHENETAIVHESVGE